MKTKPIKWLLKAIPHVSIVLSGMLIVFFFIDRVNKPMAFMTNEFHKIITFILAVMSLGYSVLIIAYQRMRERQEHAKRVRAAQARRQGQRPPQANGSRQRPAQPPRQAARPAQKQY